MAVIPDIKRSDIPGSLLGLAEAAEAGSGVLFIYSDNEIVATNKAGMALYDGIDWSRRVTFEDCFWYGIECGRTIDFDILKDPSGYCAFAKIHRAWSPGHRFTRRHGDTGIVYDRHHIGINRQWNAQVWLPIAPGGAIDFVFTANTTAGDVRKHVARERALSRLSAFLDGSGVAVAIMDGTGLLLDSTLPMMRLLCRGEFLRLGADDRIEAVRGDATQRIRGAALEISLGRRNACLIPLPIPGGRQAMAGLLSAGPTDPAVILAVARQGEADELEALLCDAFRLTPSEAAVAIRVADGETAEAIADDWGRSVSTIRGHLDKAKKEIGITRQHDLAALVTKAATLVGGISPTKLNGE